MKALLRGRPVRGVAEVEFALILPLLLLMSLGVVDIGRALIAYVELEQAAQEGALFGSFAPNDPDLIEARVRSSSEGLVDFDDDTGVSVMVECPDDDRKVAVRVSHSIPIITPIAQQMFGGSFDLEALSVGTNFTELPCLPT